MLQQVEYEPNKFLAWIVRLPNLSHVIRRQQLVMTPKARLLVYLLYLVWIFYAVFVIAAVIAGSYISALVVFGIAPFMLILWLYIVVLFAWLYVEEPRRRKLLKESSRLFKNHPGIKIAIAGSYGKTSIKELLAATLGSEHIVAYTPGNKNVSISHARWIKKLTGAEKVLLIEYGEGAPGDIAKFAKNTHPDMVVLTGIAPNHLDHYKTYEAVKKDLISIEKYVEKKNIFVNGDDETLVEIISGQNYSHREVLGWVIEKISVDYEGTKFVMKKGNKQMHIHTQWLGWHQVGPVAFAAALADTFEVPIKSIEKSIKALPPYEHRMQPRYQYGAWIIDDTYNGNLQGIRAGLHLMEKLKAKRKIYVTPGLVDQGEETHRVHIAIGEAIAEAHPDKVILMQNSVTNIIREGLKSGGYKGKVDVQSNPLEFYSNLEHFVVNGDLVVMQNDWTDNYQ
jgi:UDP-N-acetylmuramoyl-tripeptide--D-alanyl-D-alanine ligase